MWTRRRLRARRLCVIVAVLAIVGFLVACGGGGDEPAPDDSGEQGAALPGAPDATGDPTTGEGAAGAAAETADGIAHEPPQRWPDPLPAEAYRVETVEGAGGLEGIVSATVEAPGVAYEAPAVSGCPGEPPRYGPGPLSGAVVYLEGVSAGAPLVRMDAELVLADCAVAPRVQLASVAARANIRAADGAEHVLRLIHREGYRDLGGFTVPATGEPVERRLRQPGLVHARCESHPGARAWIWITPHPYVALTGADGRYEISNIPGGETYTIRVWHEAFEPVLQAVTVNQGATTTVDLSVGADVP